MNKTQAAALLLAGALGGVGANSLVTAVGKDGTVAVVKTVCAVPAYLPDGGTVVLTETCGFVQAPGKIPARWCDKRADPRMVSIVADASKRLADAQVAGEARQTALKAQIDARRRDAGR